MYFPYSILITIKISLVIQSIVFYNRDHSFKTCERPLYIKQPWLTLKKKNIPQNPE